MQLINLRYLHLCILTTIILFFINAYADAESYPDISGTWVSKSENTTPIVSKYTLVQQGKHLSGKYVDEQNGKEIANSAIVGYVDKQGGIIFDLYFGRVTATNRLTLSSDGKQMEGTFTTTMGNNGKVHLIKSD